MIFFAFVMLGTSGIKIFTKGKNSKDEKRQTFESIFIGFLLSLSLYRTHTVDWSSSYFKISNARH